MSLNNQLPATGPFSLVLSRFKLSLTTDEAKDFQFTSLRDVEDVIENIQEKQKATKMIRNVNRLKPFLDAMDQYGKVVEVFLNMSGVVAFVWVFDTVLDAYESLGERIPLLEQYQSLFRQPLMRKVLVLIFEDVLEFHREALKIFKRRAWTVVFTALWKDFGTRFQKILDSLERHSRLIECQASLSEFEAAQTARRQTEHNFNELRKAEKERQMISVTKWLAPSEVHQDQERFTATRRPYPGSCGWVFKNSTVRTWLDSSLGKHSGLWLNGIPGAGKTILASAIIERLQQEENASVCFFFCKHGDPTRNSFHSIGRTFLVHLLRQNDGLLPYIYEQQVSSYEMTLGTSATLTNLLKVAMGDSGKTYVIIDGLDECEKSERAKVLTWMSSVTTTDDDSTVKVAVISTNEPDIKRKLSKFLKKKLEPEDVKEDLQIYLNSRVVELQEKFELPESTPEAIVRTILERANGMFLYAYLTVENLLSQPTKALFEHELQPHIFPTGLGQAYDRIVRRIYNNPHQAQKLQAMSLLGWVVCARRPLTWNEIQGAASIDLEARKVDHEGRRIRDDINDLCGCLIEIQSDIVQLVHTTAKFHLVNQRLVGVVTEEMKLARLCVWYLSFGCFRYDLPYPTVASNCISGSYVFLEYAAVNWISHVQACSSNVDDYNKDEIDSLAQQVETLLNLHLKGKETCPAVSSTISGRIQPVERHPVFIQLNELASAKQLVLKLDGPFSLGRFIVLVRAELESLAQDEQYLITLRAIYGTKLFKCTLSHCVDFHRGFSSSATRNQHLSQHERPFKCLHTGCPRVELGFPSIRELNSHLSNTHPRQVGEDNVISFPASSFDEGTFDDAFLLDDADLLDSFDFESFMDSATNTQDEVGSDSLERDDNGNADFLDGSDVPSFFPANSERNNGALGVGSDSLQRNPFYITDEELFKETPPAGRSMASLRAPSE
ncbi:hypothetical protein K440DRAFT_601451 [Wilcoxina mikolae CBS 423.85]|nr:hypothetical protein K440DRAFT_601451 [Wilcoxina mikolae CBS 423.85]